MTPDRANAISKVLSPNDVGATGAHQAGMLIPRRDGIVDFFPRLDGTRLNPRHHLGFRDHNGRIWTFAFIYYNNRFFGGTRNEYRLTHMTPYFHELNLHAGDTITLKRDGQGGYHIVSARAARSSPPADGILRLGSRWRVIRI
jgi:hypothetical protein